MICSTTTCRTRISRKYIHGKSTTNLASELQEFRRVQNIAVRNLLCSDSELEHQLMAAKQKIVDLKIDGNKAKDQLMAAEQKIDGSKAAQVRRNSKETQIINELKCESAANKIDSMENHDIAKVLDFDFI
eukprot:576827_1